MFLISSRMTFFYKRIFPAIWFGALVLFIIAILFHMHSANGNVGISALIIPIVMAVGGYFLMKVMVFDLFDEVWVSGDSIIVKNNNIEQQILLSDIKNISYSNFSNPQRVTLALRKPCLWGDEISFCPPINFAPFVKNSDVQDLIDRVDAARKS